MIMSFQELKSEEYVLNLVFCFDYFDDSQLVGRWVSGRWVSGWWLAVLIKPMFYKVLNTRLFCKL